jgi:hypothetical protein
VSTIASAAAGLETLGIEPVDFAVRRSSLDDVFLALTGQPGRTGGPADAGAFEEAGTATATTNAKQKEKEPA